MGLIDVFQVGKIKRENEHLREIVGEVEAAEILDIKEQIDLTRKTLGQMIRQKEQINSELKKKVEEINEKKAEIIVLDEELMLESFALYKPKFNFQSSAEYSEKLKKCRDAQKQLIKAGNAVHANEAWTVNNSKSQGKKMVNDMKKLLLRSFNNECDYCVDHVKFNNMDSNVKRIEKSFETLNKLGRIMQANITIFYKKAKLEELYLAYEYQQKKQEEKEELQRARQELREQRKLEQEIKKAREKIAKEKKHFGQQISELEIKLTNENNEISKKAIVEKLEELKSQYANLENEEKIIDYREQNAKAGYVYIISNIGAFGEGVYKIGMTRRLEPMDRVSELGDASVPFPFDVHALVFSDNAPLLESKLHEYFFDSRLNKINNRKEFFRADINEIEKVVKKNYDKIVDMTKEAPAEQFRESKQL